MTFAAEKAKVGRKPVHILEIDLDYCTRTFATSPCQAGQVATDTAQAGTSTTITLAAGDTQADDYYNGMLVYIVSGTGVGQERTITDYVNATKVATVGTAWTTTPDATSVYRIKNPSSAAACNNTRGTCQDTTNYAKIAKTYKFSDVLITGQNIHHCLQSVSLAPTKITPGQGLGYRATISVKLKDFTHHDRGVDPYVANRAYDPSTQGTFFGRLLARNPHYYARDLRLKVGYISDTGLDLVNDFQTYYFLIERIEGPDANGNVTIVGKDPLWLADGKKAQAPEASTATLSAGISAVDTSLTVATGKGSEYANAHGAAVSASNPGYVRINDEIIKYEGVSTDTLTGLTRAQGGTTAAAHSSGDKVQRCLVFESTPVEEVVQELLEDYAGVPSAYIPFTDWQAEADNWLTVYALTNYITEPTEVNKLLSQLMEQCGFNIWWDQEVAKIPLRAETPQTPTTQIDTLTDANHLLKDTIKVKDDHTRRLTQVWMFYGVRNYVESDDPKNFAYVDVSADTDAETAEEYGTTEVKKIYARWLSTSAQASQIGSRQLARYASAPKVVTFNLDMKDSALKAGDHFYIQSAAIQDRFGADKVAQMQCLAVEYLADGATLKCEALSFSFTKRYWFIGPNSLPDYTAATDDQKAQYAWIADTSTEKLSNGDDPYTII